MEAISQEKAAIDQFLKAEKVMSKGSKFYLARENLILYRWLKWILFLYFLLGISGVDETKINAEYFFIPIGFFVGFFITKLCNPGNLNTRDFIKKVNQTYHIHYLRNAVTNYGTVRCNQYMFIPGCHYKTYKNQIVACDNDNNVFTVPIDEAHYVESNGQKYLVILDGNECK